MRYRFRCQLSSLCRPRHIRDSSCDAAITSLTGIKIQLYIKLSYIAPYLYPSRWYFLPSLFLHALLGFTIPFAPLSFTPRRLRPFSAAERSSCFLRGIVRVWGETLVHGDVEKIFFPEIRVKWIVNFGVPRGNYANLKECFRRGWEDWIRGWERKRLN